MKSKIDKILVKHIAQLAQIPINSQEETGLVQDFNQTLEVVDELQKINTHGVELTHQVTGLINVMRKDKVEATQMFSQQQALANTARQHNGYFVVKRVIDVE